MTDSPTPSSHPLPLAILRQGKELLLVRYMPRILLVRPQCRVLADGATMRVSLVNPRPPWRSNVFRHMATVSDSSQRLHRSLIHTDDSNIFPNNLQKTLEAHRSSNRASLIRRVAPRTSPKNESLNGVGHVGREPSNKPSSSAVHIAPAVPVKRPSRKKHRSTRTLPEPPPSILSPDPAQPDRWAADWKETPPELCPWLDYMDPEFQSSDAISHLDAEIRALEKYMVPTSREHVKVNQLVAGVTASLAGIVPHPPEVIGSWRTEFASSHSNLDIMLPIDDVERSIHNSRNPSSTRPKILDVHSDLLRKVAGALTQSPAFSRVQMSKKGFPMATAVHHSTGLRLQFYCGEALPPAVEYISNYYSEYRAVRPLYMAARVILEVRGVLGAHRSSVGSGALVMLLIAFLKMNHGRFQRSDNLGEQLLAVLETYGTAVDLKTTGVSVDPPGFFDDDTVARESIMHDEDMSARLRGQRSLLNLKETSARKCNFPNARRLCIQDPSDYMRNLGRSCTRTAELQKTLAGAHERLQVSLAAWKGPGGSHSNSILMHALQANFDKFQAKRLRLAFSDEQYP